VLQGRRLTPNAPEFTEDVFAPLGGGEHDQVVARFANGDVHELPDLNCGDLRALEELPLPKKSKARAPTLGAKARRTAAKKAAAKAGGRPEPTRKRKEPLLEGEWEGKLVQVKHRSDRYPIIALTVDKRLKCMAQIKDSVTEAMAIDVVVTVAKKFIDKSINKGQLYSTRDELLAQALAVPQEL
jgi:hypothetical protein